MDFITGQHIEDLRAGITFVLWGGAIAVATYALSRDRDLTKTLFWLPFGAVGAFYLAFTILSIATNFIWTVGA